MTARVGVALGVLTFLGAYVYSNTLDVPFVFDDFPAIVDNPAVRAFPDLGAIWSWWPLRFGVTLTFALDYALFGFSLAAFHLTNLAVHVLAGVAVWLFISSALRIDLARRGGPNRQVARTLASLAAAGLFVVHPLQTQAVTYVWQRVASLGALFYVGALALHLLAAERRMATPTAPGDEGLRRRARAAWRFEVGAFAFALCAMFTKQFAVTLPIAVLLLDGVLVRPPWRDRQPKVLALLWLALLLVIPAVVLLVGDPAVGHMEAGGEEQLSPFRYAVTQIDVVALYVKLALLPIGQSLQHELAPSSLTDLDTLVHLALHVAVLGGGVLAALKRQSLVGLGVVLGYLMLSVESSVLPLLDVAFEHRMYLPSAGFCLALAAAISRLPVPARLEGPRGERLGVLLVTLLLLPVGAMAHARNEVWRSEVSLWADAASQYPESWRAQYNLGVALRKAGALDDAAAAFERALAAQPGDTLTHLGLGEVLAALGREDEAFTHMQAARVAAPSDPSTALQLAVAYARRGEIEIAARIVDEQLAVTPENERRLLLELQAKLKEDLRSAPPRTEPAPSAADPSPPPR